VLVIRRIRVPGTTVPRRLARQYSLAPRRI
jgi:hypothetical protein